MKKLVVIADYGNDSLACCEVKIAVEGFLKDPGGINVSFVNSTISTIHTAFLLAQIVNTEELYGRPSETVYFINCDPRIQTKEKIEKAKGADGLIIRLTSGIYITGPNAGYSFSLIKKKIDELYIYSPLLKGSQFRSRDLYARVIAHLMDYLQDELDLEETHTNIIPELKNFYVGHIDNFGNIKTTIPHEYIKGKYEFNENVDVLIGGVGKKAKFVTNLFGEKPGVLVIYPGSSGVKDNPYLELAVRIGENYKSAESFFNHPFPGAVIEIK